MTRTSSPSSSGRPEAIPEGLAMVWGGGTYLEVGNISLGKTTTIDPSMMVCQNKSIVAVVMYDPIILSVALDFLVRNKDRFPLASVISDRFPLDKIDTPSSRPSGRASRRQCPAR